MTFASVFKHHGFKRLKSRGKGIVSWQHDRLGLAEHFPGKRKHLVYAVGFGGCFEHEGNSPYGQSFATPEKLDDWLSNA